MSGPATIASLTTRRLRALMPRPWVPESPHLHLIVVEVVLSDGTRGTGFTWTPTIGVSAVDALLTDDISRFAVGQTADPATLWPRLWRHLHEAGGGGVTTIAMAGLDLALWDAVGRRADLPLADLLGRRRGGVRTYGSGVNLHVSRAELLDQVRRWIDAGHDTVKVKVGHPDVATDLDRIGAVRDLLGPGRTLLVDANQRWDLRTAVTAITALARFDLGWIEEPLRSDDTRGYRDLAREIDVPIAMGENVHTIHRFRDLVDLDAIGVLQPNVVRVGGITPFLEIAKLIEASSSSLAPHLLPEISGQLAMALDAEVQVEDVEDAGFDALGVLAAPGPTAIDGTILRDTGRAGLGLVFA